MKIIKIKNIEIRYNESQLSQIDSIKNIINNNISLLSPILKANPIISLTPTEDKDILYIDDFDKYFSETITQIVNHEDTQNLFNAPNFIPTICVEILINQYYENGNTFLEPNPAINDEILNFFISYEYFKKNDSLDDFINYLKNRNDTDKILKWVYNEYRFEIYNYLLNITIDNITEHNFEDVKKLSKIINKMFAQFTNNISQENNQKKENIPSLDTKELDNLFTEFLESINAPEDWKEKYIDLKANNKIIFQERIGDIDCSECFFDNDDILKIFIHTDGSLVTFWQLAHEFSHYISINNPKEVPDFSILEFSSIFFEKLAAEFLRNKGYSSNLVKQINMLRTRDNIETYMKLAPLFNDISSYINKGPIQRSDKIKLYKEQFKTIQKTREKLMRIATKEEIERAKDIFINFDDINLDAIVDGECDSLIVSFIRNGLLILNGYQYLLDTLLAEEVLKKSKEDPNVIDKMIHITNKLSHMNLKDILNIFDIHYIFDEEEALDKGMSRTRKQS